MNLQQKYQPGATPLPVEPNPREKIFSGYDFRDLDYYKKLSYYRTVQSFRLFNHSWPSFSDYEMPYREVERLKLGLDPFDFSSFVQPGRVVEIEREYGFEEDLIKAARIAWLDHVALHANDSRLVDIEKSTVPSAEMSENEVEFISRFITVDETVNSTRFTSSLELVNARRRTRKLYIETYFPAPKVENRGKAFQKNLIGAARNAWLSSPEKINLEKELDSVVTATEQERTAIDAEEEFISLFISNDKTIDSTGVGHRLQVANARQRAKKLYIETHLRNI